MRKRYLVINNADGNDFFEVLALNDHAACVGALSELGWSISVATSEDDDEDD
jgi:hypothetical protein